MSRSAREGGRVNFPGYHIRAPPSSAPSLFFIDYRYYDQNTFSEVAVDHLYGRFPSSKTADKLLRMNYDIHTGAILGLPGKILAFLAGLTCASLPVTGTMMWLGRKRKYL